MSRQQIQRLHDKIYAAKDALSAYVSKTYAHGDFVRWEIGGFEQAGFVRRVCDDRLEVTNERTGKTRFIYATDIL